MTITEQTLTENPDAVGTGDVITLEEPAGGPAAPTPSSGAGVSGQPPPLSPEPRTGRWSLRRVSVHGWITLGIGLVALGLYTWNLSANGWANDYYSAAVKAASVDWKAFFFGSIDPGNFITVDKPPAALWLMAVFTRVFGFSSFTMLVPQALAGVGSVLVLHHLVKRWAGDIAAHLAAAALAVTPVSALMFRFNNPDALLTLLGLVAAWALWKALESAKTRYLVLSGALVGLAFNTKMLQAFLVLPAFILVYLIAGKPSFWRRIGQLFAALVSLVISCSWWVAVVALWPADTRPWIGSTTDNNILSLVFGYNGFARIFGGQGPGGGGPGGGGGGANFGGASGWLRMFNSINAGQISWLIPFALAGLAAGLWVTRRAPRTSLVRAGWILWGGWTITCLTVFSKSSGIFHPYYSVQLAPGVAALAGAGGFTLWQLSRNHRWMRWALPVAVVGTAAWSVAILQLTPSYQSWLRPAIVIGATASAVGLWIGWRMRSKVLVAMAAAVAAVILLAGPTAYTLTTITSSQNGPMAAAGPSSGANAGAPGGRPATGADGDGTTARDGAMRAGGPGRTATADSGLVSYLQTNRGDATYLVAAFGSQSSSSIIIATGEPVMTIGGFNGSDPAPSLEAFQQMVANGQVRFVLVGGGGPGGGGPGGGGPGGRNGTTGQISSWVTQNGTAVDAATYGGAGTNGTLYDLRGAVS